MKRPGKKPLSITERVRKVLRKRLLSAVLIAAVFILGGFAVQAAKGPQSRTEPTEYVYGMVQVQRGDSLWKIAEKYAGQNNTDIRSYVKELKRMNRLKYDYIESGRNLMVRYRKSR